MGLAININMNILDAYLKDKLNEAALTFAQLRKVRYGDMRYYRDLITKIKNEDPVTLTDGSHVVIASDQYKKLNKAVFGTEGIPKDWVNQIGQMPGGDKVLLRTVSAGGDPNRMPKGFTLKLENGESIKLSDIDKITVRENYNRGDVAEIFMGLAVTAKILYHNKEEVTFDDCLKIINESTINSADGSLTFGSPIIYQDGEPDRLDVNIRVRKNSMYHVEKVVLADGDTNEFKGFFQSAISYINSKSPIIEKIKLPKLDKASNKVIIRGVGTEDQKGTKADLVLQVDNTVINLLSVKANTRQVGQITRSLNTLALKTKAGVDLQAHFNEFFGLNVFKINQQAFVQDPTEALRDAYTGAVQSLNTAVNSPQQEFNFLDATFNFLQHHATLGSDIDIVMLSADPNNPMFTNLKFDETLKTKLEKVNFIFRPPRQSGNPIVLVNIFPEEKIEELPDFDQEIGLYSIRSYLQKSGNVRTVIEIGNGAHLLADQKISINSSTMENIKETASAGSTSAGNVATVNAPLGKGKMIKRQKVVSADANEVGMFPKEIKEKAVRYDKGEQVKGSDPTPKAKPGRTKHPFTGKLVGDSMTNDKNDKLKEGVLDASDEDGWMAKEQLYKTAQYAINLHKLIGDTDNLEPWIQSKITKAADYLGSVKHYMEYEQVNPHPTDEPDDESVAPAMDMIGLESANPRLKKGMERIFGNAQEDLATSLVK
ncbi:MAG TPA: hypothetical protein DCS22_01635 [Flavobacteriaceae bacterium]|nr:hypothetical protein [Flavobacteriaceae bacterium]|tara:strand:+ start:1261 stop:3396 length:2136 start_codon:yes stop_codon:yes gene_type:complete